MKTELEGLFEWDQANVAHIARHGITPEEVVCGRPLRLDVTQRFGELRRKELGATREGRILLVVAVARAYKSGLSLPGKRIRACGIFGNRYGGNSMSLQPPEFESESQEAEWWYDHRAEVEAEFLLASSEGRLKRSTGLGEDDFVDEPAHSVDAGALKQARELLERSGSSRNDRTQSLSDSVLPSEKFRRAS